MHLDPTQQVAILIAASAMALLLAVQFRPRKVADKPVSAWYRFAHEAGLGVLTGGFVALAFLAAVRVVPESRLLRSALPHERLDLLTLICVVATLVLLCSERARWTGHQPATILAAIVPWLLVSDWGTEDGARLPAAQLGLFSAVIYRVLLSGARYDRLVALARHAAVEATGDAVVVVDEKGELVEANAKGREAFFELANREEQDELDGVAGSARLPDRVCTLLAKPEAKHFSLRNRNGRVYEIWLGPAGSRYIANSNRALVVRDVSTRRRDEQHLHRLAHYDSLTGLANRRLFIDNLDKALRRASDRNGQVGLLYIDLDRFKEINDTLGHGAGDELLRVIAERFLEHLRTNYPSRLRGPEPASVARLGGDEFAVILPQPENQEEVEHLARCLLEAICLPIPLSDREIAGSGSIGLALYPRDGGDVETLVKHADSALYEAKRRGRNRHECYRPEFSREADRTRAIEQELRGAIERHEFELHYQPKIDVQTDTVSGFEALLRWKSRELGVVGPAEFIPIAEERGLIVEIGSWCLKQACKQLRLWREAGYDVVPVAVNVSSAQFIGSNLQDLVERSLLENELEPELLELELTERLLLEDNEQTSRCLADLKKIGVPLALDDFGTGYSALTYLNRFPLSVVKMDRDLLHDIETNDSSAGITAAVVSMCHSLDLKVVAEGVDSEVQLEMLREMSCDMIQGFIFSPALPASDVTRFLGGNGILRPVLKQMPTAPSRAIESARESALELEPDEWETSTLEPKAASGLTPRALIIDDTGSLQGIGQRLEHLGVEVVDITTDALTGCFVPPDDGDAHLVVVASDGALHAARRVHDELTRKQVESPPFLLVTGEKPAEDRRQEIRQSGARWVLWTPFEDTELRFLVRAAMPLEHSSVRRDNLRIPLDVMAWIRAGARREVGVLSSLSRRGAFIEMKDPPEEGASVKLEFELPVGRIATFARVIHQQVAAAADNDICAGGIGVSFYGLDPASKFAIRDLVEENAAKYLP